MDLSDIDSKDFVALGHMAQEVGLSRSVLESRLRSRSWRDGVVLMCKVPGGGVMVPVVFFRMVMDAIDECEKLVVRGVGERSIQAVPINSGPCVYFLTLSGEIVYIGQSVDVLSRVACHRKEKVFDGVFCFSVEAEELDLVEAVNIRHYNPPINQVVPRDPVINHALLVAASEYAGCTEQA